MNIYYAEWNSLSCYSLVLRTQNFKVPPPSETVGALEFGALEFQDFWPAILLDINYLISVRQFTLVNPVLCFYISCICRHRQKQSISSQTEHSVQPQNQCFQFINTKQKSFVSVHWAKRKERCLQYYWFHVHTNRGLKLQHWSIINQHKTAALK